jgi:periplasmic copper chaperone A
MFTDLKARLVKGQSVKGRLTFANAGTVDVEFAIEGMGATAGTTAHGIQMDHMQMR